MKKTALSLLFISLIICSSLLMFDLDSAHAQTGSNVSGIISSDTTWTKVNSPYLLTGNVLVDTNVTLVIESGVTIEFNSYFMNVGGTLAAKGTELQRIIMKGSGTTYSGQWNGRIVFLSTSINSTLEFVEITSTPNTIIGIFSSSPTIENCIISGTSGTALSIMASPKAVPNIANNTISNNKDGILLDSTDTNVTPKISSNIIINNSGSGVILNHGQPQISLNRIANNTYGISYGGGINGNDSCTINDNIISNNKYGIFINPSGFGRNFNLIKNLIINNDNAIYIEHSLGAGRGNVTSNTIAKNNNGIVSTGPVSLVINQNNIYEINNYFVKLASTYDTDATNNWWGTTNNTIISQSLYDFYDDFNLGKIVFSPFLNGLSPTAPTIPFVNISANAGVGGSIDPSGNTSVCYGSNQTYRISPDTGYHILNVAVNGTSVGIVSIYTIQDITGATTISALFTPDPTPTPTPTVTPKPTASPTPSPSPAQSPIATPTATPTQLPTSNPTTNPTQQPTTNPTTCPTIQPTTSPTQNAVTPTPTVPEYSALVLVPLLLSLLSIAMLLKHKKRA